MPTSMPWIEGEEMNRPWTNDAVMLLARYVFDDFKAIIEKKGVVLDTVQALVCFYRQGERQLMVVPALEGLGEKALQAHAIRLAANFLGADYVLTVNESWTWEADKAMCEGKTPEQIEAMLVDLRAKCGGEVRLMPGAVEQLMVVVDGGDFGGRVTGIINGAEGSPRRVEEPKIESGRGVYSTGTFAKLVPQHAN